MKTPSPLAAALLMLAASASAQLLSGPSGSGFSMTGTSQSPFSFGSTSGPVDDVVFKCGTVPYIACTDVHMNKREAIRISGVCPAPASAACTEYLMSTRGATNPAETIAAYTPPPGREWASPDCQRIPCRLADPPPTDEIVVTGRRPTAPTESGLPYDQQPGFIGPPAPPSGPSMPPPFSSAEFQRELADARSDNQHTVVDLGNNRYGVVLDDGSVSVCGRGQCSTPRPASEFPDLADRIQAATSLNSGAGSLNDDNPNGFTKSSNPPSTPPGDSGRSGRSGQGTTAPPSEDVASNPSDEARTSGGDAGAFFRGNGGGGQGAGAGGTSGNGYAAAAANGKEEAIATQAAELDGVFTYIKTREIKAKIDRTEGAVTSGGDGTFVTPNTAPDANAGDLKFKGTQSGANR